MDKFKYILFSTLLAASAGLSSCDEDFPEEIDEQEENTEVVAQIDDIQGKWHGRQNGVYYTFSFYDKNHYIYGSGQTSFWGMITDSWGTFELDENKIVFTNDNDAPCEWSGCRIYFTDSNKKILSISDSLLLTRMQGDTENVFID